MILWAFLLVFGSSTAVAVESLRAKNPPRAAVKAAVVQVPEEIWSLKVEGRPQAVFFDAATSALWVSVNDGNGRARLDKVSLEGKREEKGAFGARGEAGALRAYGGNLFWVVGSSVKVFDPKKGSSLELRHYPAEAKGTASDIAIARDGAIYLSFINDSMWRVGEAAAAPAEAAGTGPVKGLFVLSDKHYLLRGSELWWRQEKAEKKFAREPFCDCRWLERTSAGKWLTTRDGEVLIGLEPVLTLKTRIGRPAWVFRMDSTQDFFVLPLPEQGMLRAYRMPGTENPKKTEK